MNDKQYVQKNPTPEEVTRAIKVLLRYYIAGGGTLEVRHAAEDLAKLFDLEAKDFV